MPTFLCPHCRCQFEALLDPNDDLLRCPTCRQTFSCPAGQQMVGAPVASALQDNSATGSFHDDPALGETTPPPDPAGATTAEEASPRAAAGLEQVPGYAVERILGKGGMGVVYQATDLRLKRRVALKMILAGGHAGEQELARFKTEAEAIARLQHPHIVQIYEVGEHEGRPYFCLEFCPGGSLDKKLAGTPLPAREAAALGEKLAVAMQAAHDKGVIHRDLKPANVLLAKDGMPKITDFGLARKLDEAGQTQTGAVMGTPSYMAPEQARGEGKDIGPACDVYALGAILYECLTGRPPFKAATLMDTLRQVLHDEPVPPTQLQSQTPRDLETIALKCLQKEPDKRYSSAAALADDLARFQRGEPIAARPVGQLERGWRWCRRNPGLAGALAAVFLVLTGGITVSSILAVQADKARGEAQQESDNAYRSEERATQSADKLATMVAEGLRRPLALRVRPQDAMPPLNDPEVDSLWDLASTSEEKVRLRFVEQALRSPIATHQLRDRSELAMQAALGLDSRRHAQVERLLGERLTAGGATEEEQVNVASILASCGIEEQALATRAAVVLAEQMNKTTIGNYTRSPLPLARALVSVAGRLDSEGARKAAAALIQTISTNNDDHFRQPLILCLAAVAARLDLVGAREAAGALSQAMSKAKDQAALQRLTDGLTVVAARLEPGTALDLLLRTISTVTDISSGQALGVALHSAAARLDPEAGPKAAATLILVMSKSTDLGRAAILARALAAVTERLHPAAAREVATALTRAMNQRTPPFLFAPLAQGLSALAARLGPAEAREVAAALVRVMSQTAPPYALPTLAQALMAVAARLDVREVAAAAGQAADLLIRQMSRDGFDTLRMQFFAEYLAVLLPQMRPSDAAAAAGQAAIILTAMDQKSDPFEVQHRMQGLSAVAARLDRAAAREAAAALNRTMSKTTIPFDLQHLAQGLAAVAPRLEPSEAATALGKAVAILIQAMDRQSEERNLPPLAQGLSALAAQLGPAGAQEAAAALAQALSKARANTMPALVQALSAVAPRLDPGGAKQAALTLIQAMSKFPPPTQEYLAQGLSAVAGRLDAVAAREAAAALARAMSMNTDPNRLHVLAQGLSAVGPRLDLASAREMAATLVPMMSKNTWSIDLRALAEAVSVVAARLEAKERAAVARQASAILVQAMSKTISWSDWQAWSAGLSALAAQLEAGQAREIAAALTPAMSQSRDGEALKFLAKALSAVAARLDTPERAAAAGQGADLLIREMSKHNKQPYLVLLLAQGLAPLMAQQRPAHAAAAAGQAATILARAMGQTAATPQEQQWMAQALSGLVAHLDSEGAGNAATALMLAMSRNMDPNILLPGEGVRLLPFDPAARNMNAGLLTLAEKSLAEVLSREAVVRIPSRPGILAAAAAAPFSPGTGLATPALLCTLTPPPPPLPAQVLVDLLKEPFCVGPARRLVLDQLERHYQRRFADQWDFVHFAQERQLDLDLGSPPQRPDAETLFSAAEARK